MFENILILIALAQAVSPEQHLHIMRGIINVHRKAIATKSDINLLDIYKIILNNINLDNSQCKLVFENCLFRIDSKNVDTSDMCYPLYRANLCLTDREFVNAGNSECTHSSIKDYLLRYKSRINNEIDACVKTYPLNFAYSHNNSNKINGFIFKWFYFHLSLLFLIYF
jgi:hypothetical protein